MDFPDYVGFFKISISEIKKFSTLITKIVMALICIPIMLFVKPCITFLKGKKDTHFRPPAISLSDSSIQTEELESTGDIKKLTIPLNIAKVQLY